MSRFMTPRAADMLTQHLPAETDGRITYKILRGLGRCAPTIRRCRSTARRYRSSPSSSRARRHPALRIVWPGRRSSRRGLRHDTTRALLLPRPPRRRAPRARGRLPGPSHPRAGCGLRDRLSRPRRHRHAGAGRRAEMLENLLRGTLRPVLLLAHRFAAAACAAGRRARLPTSRAGARDSVQAVVRTSEDPRRMATALHAILPDMIARLSPIRAPSSARSRATSSPSSAGRRVRASTRSTMATVELQAGAVEPCSRSQTVPPFSSLPPDDLALRRSRPAPHALSRARSSTRPAHRSARSI